MAIYWGPFQNKMRIGIGVVQRPGTVTQSTTSVALDLEVHIQMDEYGSQYINDASITFTGDWYGSVTFPIRLGPNQQTLVWYTTVSYPTYVGAGQNKSFGVTINQYHGGTYHGVTWWIPPRPNLPPVVPAAPSGLTVARNTDTKQTLSWTRNATYTSVLVQRRRAVSTGAWQQVGVAMGNAASYVDTSTTADQAYLYRVAGINAAGQSSWSPDSSVLFTTPAPVKSVTAARQGTSIIVKATGPPTFTDRYDVMDVDVVVATNVALPWTHTNPAPQDHEYRLKSVLGSLKSGWSTPSNLVSTAARPNPPSQLAPNGRSVGPGPLTLSWLHNPTDSSEQSQQKIRWRAQGVSAWTERAAVTTSEQSQTLDPLAALPGYGAYEWQAATRGSHADWSLWSATATFDLIQVPQVTVTVPGPLHILPSLTAEWLWFQAQGRPQSEWEFQLLDATGTVIETQNGAGPTVARPLTTRLADGASYTLSVRAAAGGVWSDWTELAFEVAFVPPPLPILDGGWNELVGSMSVSVVPGVPVDDEPDTTSVDILRSVDGGASWETVILQADPMAALDDWESLSYGQTMYRAIAYADTGASSMTDLSLTARSNSQWISGGMWLDITGRLPYNPAVKVTAGRARSVQRYDGRPLGVAYVGEQLSRIVEASGDLIENDPDNVTVDRFETIAQADGAIHMYRDADGRRIYGSLSTVPLQRGLAGADGAVWSFSFQLEETGH